MKVRIFLFIYIWFILLLANGGAEEKVFIELKIENEIITNIDIYDERNYLIALNNNLKKLSKNQIYNLSKNSLIREKIKKIELSKYFNLDKPNKHNKTFIEKLYRNLKFKNVEEFQKYLDNYNLSIENIEKKILIETLWNQLIFDKYNKNVKVDEKKLRAKLKNELKKNKIEEFNLSEIIFELKLNENIKDKQKKIIEFIKNNSFENAANIYSISDSSKFGGKIGWTNKAQITKNILNEIEKIEIGGITNPIQINNSYIILKVNEKRMVKKDVDFEKQIKNLIIYEKDRQLNQYSLMYFNRIKKNLFINDL